MQILLRRLDITFGVAERGTVVDALFRAIADDLRIAPASAALPAADSVASFLRSPHLATRLREGTT